MPGLDDEELLFRLSEPATATPEAVPETVSPQSAPPVKESAASPASTRATIRTTPLELQKDEFLPESSHNQHVGHRMGDGISTHHHGSANPDKDVHSLPSNIVRFTHEQCYPKISGAHQKYFEEFGSHFPDLVLSLHRPFYPEVTWGGPVDIEVNCRRGAEKDAAAAREALLGGLKEYAFRCAPGYRFDYIYDYYEDNRESFHPPIDQVPEVIWDIAPILQTVANGS